MKIAFSLLFALALAAKAADPAFEDADTSASAIPPPAAAGLPSAGGGPFSLPQNNLDMQGPDSDFWKSYVFDPMRVTLTHEFSYKVEDPDRVLNNRSWARLEYSKFFLSHLSLRFDGRTTAFWEDDHRSRMTSHWVDYRRSQAQVTVEAKLLEAYLQASILQTSIKAGIQTLPWGESQMAIISDEVSPRDNKELFNFNLEELRIGQPMLLMDQYNGWGKWSSFFIPYPGFNEYPAMGSAYYYDPFGGNVDYRTVPMDQSSSELIRNFEYGSSWRNTFGKNEVGLMTASLTDNDYALDNVGPGIVDRKRIRFQMTGMTYSHAFKTILLKGEFAMKFPKAFQDDSLRIVKRNVADALLAAEYSSGSSYFLSLEASVSHIVDWDGRIQSAPRNRFSLMSITRKLFLHDDLSLSMLNLYSGPYTGFLAMFFVSYKCNDHLALEANVSLPTTENKRAGLWIYRDQKQVALNAKYLF